MTCENWPSRGKPEGFRPTNSGSDQSHCGNKDQRPHKAAPVAGARPQDQDVPLPFSRGLGGR